MAQVEANGAIMERTYRNIQEMYNELMYTMHLFGKQAETRNGDVLSIEEPVLVRVTHPCERVLNDPIRHANPFFHVMEFVWMMAGESDVTWIEQFNGQMREYAEDNGHLHAAYGYRWREAFGIDQISVVIEMLRKDPDTRRAVIAMWSAQADLDVDAKDLPCNTHIYFRLLHGRLNMMVCNRSNDVVWGMTGANAVHMTFLQELVAQAIQVEVGEYQVVTMNAHVYLALPHLDKMLVPPKGNASPLESTPLLSKGELYEEFLTECRDFVHKPEEMPNNFWLRNVAHPMRKWYLGTSRNLIDLNRILADDWRDACKKWLHWKAQ